MSYHKDYIQGLCHDSPSWVVDQICGELDKRDENIKFEKDFSSRAVALFSEYQEAMEWEMGSDWTERILKQYREKFLTCPIINP